MNHFESKGSSREEINGGMKVTFTNTGDPILTVSCYTSSGKLMIQPGRRAEADLLSFLSDFK